MSSNEISFLHIGKNAGTQVMHIAEQLESFDINITGCGHGVKLSNLSDDSKYFFSIRNPINRFRSGFYSRKRKGMPRIYSEWNKHEARAFESFEHANDLAEALFCKSDRGYSAAKAIQSISHTAMQQIDWFTRTGYLEHEPPIWIIRQEVFEDDMNMLFKRLGLALSISDVDLAQDQETAHKNDYSETPVLTELAVANLKTWYARDFVFYELCERWIEENILDAVEDISTSTAL